MTDAPTLRRRALTPDDADLIAGWHYDGPWAVYDVPESGRLTAELGDYSAIVDDDDVLHAFFCQGAAARVQGLVADPRYVDVGIGLDPAIVGKGRGAEVGQLVLRHLAGRHGAQGIRAVVQSWNQRSLRLARNLGFVEVGTHDVDGVGFTVLVNASGREPERSAGRATRPARAAQRTPPQRN